MAKNSNTGLYRSIMTVLHDTRDYRQLSPEAKLTLLTLRTSAFNNQAGIFMFDAGSFVTLQERTGYTADTLEKALQELCQGLFIGYQYPILWVINSLRDEPNISLNNANQKKGVLNVIGSLPPQEIIVNFCEYYGLPIPLGYPSQSLKLPSGYPMRYRRALGEYEERINNNSGQQLEILQQRDDSSSSATPHSEKNQENGDRQDRTNSVTPRKWSSPEDNGNDQKKSIPPNGIDRVTTALAEHWPGKEIKPGAINKLLNEGFDTYETLIACIEMNKAPKDDAYGYLYKIAHNAESIAKYQKEAEKKPVQQVNGINIGGILKTVNDHTTGG